MKNKQYRIVVRVEITTLLDDRGKLSHDKMDRLAMVLSNLKNSGKQILLVSSGAIVLGTEKLGLSKQPVDYIGMMATAAAGQAELIKIYQHHFGEYNQIVAQVLLTADIIHSLERVENARNTFNTLLEMNILPIINENDVVSTSDIELNDNYPLALNVARIVEAHMILVKYDNNGKFLIIPRGKNSLQLVNDEKELLNLLENFYNKMMLDERLSEEFPTTLENVEI
ncbi:MAG: hypothetical protein JXJ22_18805 [Bacteroidales bacterium]|nr:hypothetical protein [Bacteroidales bacterium]